MDVDGWYHALRRYKPYAARGVDGFAKQDLERMTRSQVADLVSFLSRIENGETQWPAQMLIGLIMNLDKENQKQGVAAFRPICILSIVFRTWSSIRTRQMLLSISKALDQGLYGYLPQRESKEIWLTTQIAIELACLEGVDQLGLSADLVAAFNTLPRGPVFAAAKRLGVPKFLINCWGSFIRGLKRFFVVRGEVGDSLSSSTGFPEGGPMSTLAMTIVDWAWHVYMQQFAPRVVPLSFVDNLSCLATKAADLAQAFTCIQCFAEAWGLEVDHEKTFAWGLTNSSRSTLKALQFRVVGQAKDLGGLMTYGKRPRFASQDRLLDSLDSFWQGLRRSRAPMAQKLEMLPIKAWARVLHGSSGCMLSESRLSSLRAKAVGALNLHSAGSSSALRLVLAQDMTCDPGFYQFWHLISDLRRIGLKQPELPDCWAKFTSLFQGSSLPGPFSTLLQLCTRTGGSVCPPFLQTMQGLRLDLFRAPKGFMRKLMEQEWVNMVARQHTHRQAMQELSSLDLSLAHLDAGRLSPVEKARVSALQSGCYIVDAQHCKYDTTKTGQCSLCGVPDTVEHRVKDCPRFLESRQGSENTLAEWAVLPKSPTHHLLVPQNPWVSQLLCELEGIPTSVPEAVIDGGEWHDIFTDGTRLFQGVFALAAWAVVNATVGQVLEASPLKGGYQTVPRAELEAALFAVRWGLCNRLCVSLWTDSTYVSEGMQAILRGHEPDIDSENWDLWEGMCMAIQGFPEGTLGVRHVPSHLDEQCCESAFEDWVAKWNGHVDLQADVANRGRSQSFVDLHGKAREYHELNARRVRELRSVFLRIAQHTEGRKASRAPEVVEDKPIAWQARMLDLSDRLTLDWQQKLMRGQGEFSLDCCSSVLHAILGLDTEGELCTHVSWIEIVFCLKVQKFQFWHRPAGDWTPVGDSLHSPKPTLAGHVFFLRRVISVMFRILGLSDFLVDGIDLSFCGVIPPQGGILLGIEPDILNQAHGALTNFTAGRFIRKAADLSRPI